MNVTKPVRDLVYDVGLHQGEDTAYYLAKGYRVVSFEADPQLAGDCRRRFGAEIAEGRLTIVEGAVDVSGATSVAFYRDSQRSMWGTIDPSWVGRNLASRTHETVVVKTVDFTEQLTHTGVPHFMKVDIEGADLDCIEALRGQPAMPKYLSLESDKVAFVKVVAEFDLLESLGYDRFAVVQQAGMERRQITTKRIDGTHLTYRFEPHSSGGFGSDVGPWISREEALARYRQIFRMYRLLGDESLLRRTRVGRIVRGQAARLLRRPLPGWYDTHAQRAA